MSTEKPLQYIRDRSVAAIALHDDLMEALTALEMLTTACATNAGVMNSISLSVFEQAVEAEERARKHVNELGGAPALKTA